MNSLFAIAQNYSADFPDYLFFQIILFLDYLQICKVLEYFFLNVLRISAHLGLISYFSFLSVYSKSLRKSAQEFSPEAL